MIGLHLFQPELLSSPGADAFLPLVGLAFLVRVAFPDVYGLSPEMAVVVPELPLDVDELGVELVMLFLCGCPELSRKGKSKGTPKGYFFCGAENKRRPRHGRPDSPGWRPRSVPESL